MYITGVAPKVVMDFANMLYKDGVQVSAMSQSQKSTHRSQ